MISRRNIRVKVMQVLYSLSALQDSTGRNTEDNLQEAQRQVLQQMNQSSRVFIHLLYTLCEVARYADVDARQRAARYLRSEEDLHVSTRIVNNRFVSQLLGNEGFQWQVKEGHLASRSDKDLIKNLFHRLQDTAAYKEYTQQTQEDDLSQDKNILLYLFNSLFMEDEDFDQYMGDLYLQWQDDKKMMQMLVGNYLQKPTSFNFRQLVSREKREYATELVRTVIEKKEICLKWIQPRLQNWDPDRVAIIDMLLLNMGISEFLYFPSIPPKVTINEYIDLAKMYSTPQSGQFVNGVLDNILKDLKKSDKLNKTERARK